MVFSCFFLQFLPLKSSSIYVSPVQPSVPLTVCYLRVTVLVEYQVKIGYIFSLYNFKYQTNEMKIKNGISTSAYDLLRTKQLAKGICLYLVFKSKPTVQLLLFSISAIFADKSDNRLVSPVCYTILFLSLFHCFYHCVLFS